MYPQKKVRLPLSRRGLLLTFVVLALIAALSTLLGLTPPAQANAPFTKENVRLKSQGVPVDNPCTGEELRADFIAHFLLIAHRDANDTPTGGGAHLTGLVNLQGRALSSSGTEYVVVATGKENINVRFQTMLVSRDTASVKFIGRGTAEGFTVRNTYRFIVVHPNDEFRVIVELDKTEIVCK